MLDPKPMDFAQLEDEEHELDRALSHLTGLKADVTRKIENEQVGLVELRARIEGMPADRETTAVDLQIADDMVREKERNIVSFHAQIDNTQKHIDPQRDRRRLIRQEMTRRRQPEMTQPLLNFARDVAMNQLAVIEEVFDKMATFGKMNDVLQAELRSGMDEEKKILAGGPEAIAKEFGHNQDDLIGLRRRYRTVLDIAEKGGA